MCAKDAERESRGSGWDRAQEARTDEGFESGQERERERGMDTMERELFFYSFANLLSASACFCNSA